MPYISQNQRNKYESVKIAIETLLNIETKGDLEYLIALLQKKFMSTRDFKYSTLHETVYATIHAGDEFRRLYLDKREDEARKENGEI